MNSQEILDDPRVRHYLPPSRPQIRVNFYQKTPTNALSSIPRTIEINSKIPHELPIATGVKDLLSQPIYQLIAEAESRLIGRKEKIEKQKNESPMKVLPAGTEEMEDIDDVEKDEQSLLWVDKYIPKRFIELLTEEKTNREILIWLKSWDKMVFPEKYKKAKQMQTIHASSQQYRTPQDIKASLSKNKGLLNYYQAREKELTYEAHKLILIDGPPGVGKTTLARVLANHCGYTPVEVIN